MWECVRWSEPDLISLDGKGNEDMALSVLAHEMQTLLGSGDRFESPRSTLCRCKFIWMCTDTLLHPFLTARNPAFLKKAKLVCIKENVIAWEF